MTTFEELKSGCGLAFFGSHDGVEWVRLCRAIKTVDFAFQSETPISGYRFVKIDKYCTELTESPHVAMLARHGL